jgi:hypothetical protein
MERFLLGEFRREVFFRAGRFLGASWLPSEESDVMEGEDFISETQNQNLGAKRECAFSTKGDSDQILEHLQLPLRILEFLAGDPALPEPLLQLGYA